MTNSRHKDGTSSFLNNLSALEKATATKFFRDPIRNILADRGLYRFVILVEALLIGWLAFLLVQKSNDTTTVLVTPGFKGKAVVYGTYADVPYLRAVSFDAISLFASFTPKNIKSRYDQLLYYFHPGSYARWQKLLYRRAMEFGKTQMSAYFKPVDFRVLSSPQEGPWRLAVSGTESISVQGQSVKTKHVTYVLYARIINSRFWLLDIKVKKGNEEKGVFEK